jgi:hypothetical protein
MKPLLKLRLTVDHEEDRSEVYSWIMLLREEDGLIWRIDGPLGDEVEVLPRPKTVKQAKEDARAVYPKGSVWHPFATWL